MAKKKVVGICQICGETKQLTVEHYIPRAAGGGAKATLYSGDELFKTLHKDEEGKTHKPKGKIHQNGLVKHSLCKECNEQSGILYDKDFARFFNTIHHAIMSSIKIPEGQSTTEYLEDKIATIKLEDMKPSNIAKRVLVSFCSIEHPGLAKRTPEIRKAIQDKDYKPDTSDFALYMSLHLGSSAYYGTVAALKTINGVMLTQAYAGIESDFVAFYLTTDKETKMVGLENCTDITEWLTKYDYNQSANVSLELMFNKSLMIRFPIGDE
jgi:hypothetical protein